jgi:chromosome segregation ATPase
MANICGNFFDTIFPSGERAYQSSHDKITKDIERLYDELKKEQTRANMLKESLKKLENKKIPMEPNGMSRNDAIKNAKSHLISALTSIKNKQSQIDKFERGRRALEASQQIHDHRRNLQILKHHMSSVKGVDIGEMEQDIDFIDDANDDIKDMNARVNDAMVSMWKTDEEADQDMLEQFLAQSDEEYGELEKDIDNDDDEILHDIEKQPTQQEIVREKEKRTMVALF